MSWHKISYDDKTNYGTYISKLEPRTKTIPHVHTGFEEFMILEGELIDSDGGMTILIMLFFELEKNSKVLILFQKISD